jgi:hypothetical protein
MKEFTKNTSTQRAYNKDLPNKVPFTFSWKIYENEAEMLAAGAQMTPKQQLKAINAAAKQTARQASLTAALDAAGIVRPTIENDDQLRLKNMYTVLMSSKRYSEDEARELASNTLGIEWAEDDAE